MSNGSSVICIPTYNRPEVIKELIETTVEVYLQYGFDIYIYDSSDNELTRDTVSKALMRFHKLYYIRVDSSVHSNMKVYDIFKEIGALQEYHYLWVCSDSIRWSERALDAVCTYMEQGYDLIVPNYRDVEGIGNKEYTDRNDIFLDCAWHMTLYGATILKVSTMLTKVDWAGLIKQYGIPECINHSHVAFYFEKLSQLDDWRAIHLSLTAEDLHSSVFKKNPGWRDETFYVWCHCWPAMICKLPECYRNKKEVIKKNGVNSRILSFQNLRRLRWSEILTTQVYRQYKSEWKNLTNVPEFIIFFLACFPAKKVFYTSPGWVCRQIFSQINIQRQKQLLKQFCRQYEKLYIYGAGKKAARFTTYLNAWNVSFEGYLVSVISGNEKMIQGHKTFLFSNELLEDGCTGIIVALNEENTRQVMHGCLKGVDKRRIYSEFE